MFDFLKKNDEIVYGTLVHSDPNGKKTNNRRHHDGWFLVYRDGEVIGHGQDIGTDPFFRNPGDFFILRVKNGRLRVKERVSANEVPQEQKEALRIRYIEERKTKEAEELEEELERRANTIHISFGPKGITASDKGPGLDDTISLTGIEDQTIPETERKASNCNRFMVKAAKLATRRRDAETEIYGCTTYGITLNSYEHYGEFLIIEPSGRIWCHTDFFEKPYPFKKGDYVLVKYYRDDINVLCSVGYDDIPEQERRELHEAFIEWSEEKRNLPSE